MARELLDSLYYVGAVDFRVRNFHGYSTNRGSSYNAYLIVDEEVTVVDTVKAPFYQDFLDEISSVVSLDRVKNIIINHSEPDHSGALPFLLKAAPNAKVYADKMGAMLIKKHYGADIDVNIVKAGESLNIGRRTLEFIETPMVHWPDNMVTLIRGEGILLSNDIFGQHIASFERFDDEFPMEIVMHEARKYYANIVMPYNRNALRAYEALAGLDIKAILPSHGLAFRSHIPEIIDEYKRMIGGEKANKAVIIYDTMWNSTDKIARAIANGFVKAGVTTRLMNVQDNHISDVITELMDAKYACLGSPTLNNGMLATMAGMISYMKGLLSPENGLKTIAFGSYGWGGQSVPLIEKELLEMKTTPLIDKIKVQFVPTKEDLESITAAVYEAAISETK